MAVYTMPDVNYYTLDYGFVVMMIDYNGAMSGPLWGMLLIGQVDYLSYLSNDGALL